MKVKYFLPVIALLATACGGDKIPEVPEGVDVKVYEALSDSMQVIFPESTNAVTSIPELFSDDCQKKIVLTRDSKVFITFLSEGALYTNTLGWYAYKKNEDPISKSAIAGTVLFPNISEEGEGGLLKPGYTVQVGSRIFSAGTVIGFFLIEKGWEDGHINYDNQTFYTDYFLNDSKKQQHILMKFRETYHEYIILGFEDTNVNDPIICDYDFNDIVVSVTDNNYGLQPTSFDESNLIVK